MDAYVIWLIVAILFVVIEIFTPGFAVLCFGIGAFVAAVVSVYAGLNAQLLAMVIGTALSFVLVRPFVLKFMSKKLADATRTNADAVVGRRGIVSETINGQRGGRVAIDGDDWKAVSTDGSVIEAGQSVEVVSRESLILMVKR